MFVDIRYPLVKSTYKEFCLLAGISYSEMASYRNLILRFSRVIQTSKSLNIILNIAHPMQGPFEGF